MPENFHIGILAIGSELLDGRVVDSNSAWIGGELEQLGFSLRHSMTADDSEGEIIESLQFLLKRCDLIIVSGGLGPTTDDLTREAIARLLNVSIERRDEILAELHELYRRRQRPFDPSNEKQAFFPQGVTVVKNPVGTAPGFRFDISTHSRSSRVICLPGVPKELHEMFRGEIAPFLLSRKESARAYEKLTFRVFGVPEAKLNTIIGACFLPTEIVVSYRAKFPEVQLILKCPPKSDLPHLREQVRAAIGPEYIFSEDLQCSIEDVIRELLLERKATIATAESCTGGMIAALLTDRPGSSAYYLGGVSAYANSVKQSQLGVLEISLAKFGAVSEEVAKEMADGVRKQLGATIGISVTGIAGPDGGTEEKPVGLFFVGFSDGKNVAAKRYFIPLTRDSIRQYATFAALDFARREMLSIPTGV